MRFDATARGQGEGLATARGPGEGACCTSIVRRDATTKGWGEGVAIAAERHGEGARKRVRGGLGVTPCKRTLAGKKHETIVYEHPEQCYGIALRQSYPMTPDTTFEFGQKL